MQEKKRRQGATQATADELVAEEAGSHVHTLYKCTQAAAKETKKQKAQLVQNMQ